MDTFFASQGDFIKVSICIGVRVGEIQIDTSDKSISLYKNRK